MSKVLCEVKGDRAMRLLCQVLFNEFGITAGGTAVRYDDTTATYSVSTNDKMRKPVADEVAVFVRGVLAGFSASGLI